MFQQNTYIIQLKHGKLYFSVRSAMWFDSHSFTAMVETKNKSWIYFCHILQNIVIYLYPNLQLTANLMFNIVTLSSHEKMSYNGQPPLVGVEVL